MRNKLLKLVLLLLVMLLYSNACNSEATPNNAQASIGNFPYSIASQMSMTYTKDTITKHSGKPNVTRKLKNYSYEIRNLFDGSKYFIFYNNNDVVMDSWRLKKLIPRSAFKKIVIGKSTIDDVKKIDPYFIIFRYPKNEGNVSVENAISEHRLNNGGLITIEYKNNKGEWVVSSIVYKAHDSSGFKSKLLPVDRALIL